MPHSTPPPDPNNQTRRLSLAKELYAGYLEQRESPGGLDF